MHDEVTARAHTEGISLQVDVTTAFTRIPQNERTVPWMLTIRITPVDRTSSYASIAGEVGIGRLALVRQDAFNIRPIALAQR